MLIELNKPAFKPGETLVGKATWETETQGVVELIWSTVGRGEPESGVVGSATLEGPGEFTFTLPLSPWSVAGKLLTVKWSVRLTAGELKTQTDFVLSPTETTVPLGQA